MDHDHTPAHMSAMSADVPAMFMNFERANFCVDDIWIMSPMEAALLNLVLYRSTDHVMIFVITCLRSGIEDSFNATSVEYLFRTSCCFVNL